MPFNKRARIDYQARAEQASSFSGSWNKTWRCGNIREISVPFKANVTFRVLPGLNPEDGGETYDPMILPDGRFGEWVSTFPVVNCGGKNGITFIPLDDFESPSPIDSSPYKLVYRNVCKYKNSKRDGVKLSRDQLEWVTLLADGGISQANTLSYVSNHSFLQVLPYYINGKVCPAEDQLNSLFVLRLKKLATESFRNFISDTCVPNGIDITDWKTGPFITMWPSRLENPFTGEPGIPESKSYSVFSETKFSRQGYTGSSCDISKYQDQIKKELRPWADAINFASFTEQAGWLMEVLPLDLLADSWRDKFYVKTAGGPDYAFLPFVSEKQAVRLRQAYDPEFYGTAQGPAVQPRMEYQPPQQPEQYSQQRYPVQRNYINAGPQQQPRQQYQPPQQPQQPPQQYQSPQQPQQPQQQYQPPRQDRYSGPVQKFGEDYSDAYGAAHEHEEEISYAPAPDGYEGLEAAPFDADDSDFRKL